MNPELKALLERLEKIEFIPNEFRPTGDYTEDGQPLYNIGTIEEMNLDSFKTIVRELINILLKQDGEIH